MKTQALGAILPAAAHSHKLANQADLGRYAAFVLKIMWLLLSLMLQGGLHSLWSRGGYPLTAVINRTTANF